jgi:hypothetical protein
MVDYGDNPGPGAYCAKIDLTTFHSPVYSMAGKLKRPGDGVKPGPGQYDPKLGPGGPSFSLHERTNDPRNKNPGPGAYDPYEHEQLPNFSLGKRLDGTSRGKSPGPGEYDPHLGPGGPSYSLKSRLNPFRNKNPGPGTYCSNVSLTTFQSPIYSMGAKLERGSDGTKPGPGQYDPHLGPGGPSFSMHERVHDPRNKNPGPGEYDPYAHECLPNFSLGQRLDGMTGDQKPGPGAYNTDNPHTGDAPAFTMGFRIERKRPPNRNMKQLKA